MKVGVYAIYDTQTERYNMPFYARTDHEAAVIVVRAGLPKTIYLDTELYRIGTFNDERVTVEKEVVTPLLDVPSFVKVPLLPYPEKEAL